jgi:hypothetical protein
MDIRDLSWKKRPAGNTLIAEIEKLAEAVKVPAARRRDLRWMAENLRGMMTDNSSVCCCEGKALLSYVGLALQQGINFCDE